ncbi:hypothetical protein [Niveispirillum sp. KHB5.9]|uniref:hypothetical protein n=1 Tax=Niveispirillum sp. KHB5.9 TaxID=3400269 RepID=UPI003A85B903
MADALLIDVTPENVGTQMIGAGVKPGERVTVIVQRRSSAFNEAAKQVGDEAAQAGLEPEDIAEITGMKDAEFARIFGRARKRP